MNDRLIFVLSFFLLILIYAAFTFRHLIFRGHRQWKEKLNANPPTRKNYSKNDFINEYTAKGYSEKVIAFVYDKSQEFLKVEDVVLLPGDDLVNLYERQEDEWIYAVKKWIKDQHDRVPSDSELSRDLKPLNFESLIRVIEKQQHLT